MNTIIKDKIRQSREDIKVLDLKKQTLKEKSEMQKNFIEQLENSGNENIDSNKKKILELNTEVDQYMKLNSVTEEEVFARTKEQEHVTGSYWINFVSWVI